MYLDPGFGSMIIQLVVAGFAVLGGLFVTFRSKLMKGFKKGKDAEAESLGKESESLGTDAEQTEVSAPTEQVDASKGKTDDGDDKEALS